MTFWAKWICAAAVAGAYVATPAEAGVGDLLVAPTRIVLDGRKGTEIILNNIGEEPATYRISVEFRRMKADGTLEGVAQPTPREQAASDMIVYAPRRVTLAPHEPQSIRLAARAPEGLADGEYRVHLLFRAVPPPNPVVPQPDEKPKGVQLRLIPIYGVTIPVIVRLGNLQAKAGIADVRLETRDGKPAVGLELSRSGTRSTFGEVRVLKAGIKDPIAIAKGVAVYTDVGQRHVTVPIDEKFKDAAAGPVTVQYVETYDDGTDTIAETRAVLR
jgi:P pilus assembly chaperone PapD